MVNYGAPRSCGWRQVGRLARMTDVDYNVRPVLVGGPADEQEMVTFEVEPEERFVGLVIGGSTHVWERGELLDGTGPVPQQHFNYGGFAHFVGAR